MKTYVVLGAGVIGLTTALVLKERFPQDEVVIIAKEVPGDRCKTYASPCAGAHWMSYATDNGVEEERDAITYRRFEQLQRRFGPAIGIYPADQRNLYSRTAKQSKIWSKGTEKVWYDRLVPGGLRMLEQSQLPDGVAFGFDFATFVIDTQIYLSWLQIRALANGVQIRRGEVNSLEEIFSMIPDARCYFNCTGIGCLNLKDVQDTKLFATRGQVLLVQSPKSPITRLYNRGAPLCEDEVAYVFPRGPHGGIILGGCFQNNNWDGEVDLRLVDRIKHKCCQLCPELGKPEDLKVLGCSVGLRPSRQGGARVEHEKMGDNIVIHAYGFGGTGYQASWGAAEEAVNLFLQPMQALL